MYKLRIERKATYKEIVLVLLGCIIICSYFAVWGMLALKFRG